ncbi:regulator of sigma E protease [Trypanosoma cruzi]|nr:regulator of sigma E protease [Trypanosoma cruzi]
MHAALRCLGMRVRLRVTEEGNARCAPCTDETTITWVAPPYDEGKAIFRDHAQVCTISATSGRILPVVPWGGDVRGCGAGRFHWHLLNKLCYGHPSPIQKALRPAVAHHRSMWTRLLPRSIRRQRRRKSPHVPRRQRCALAQRHPGCAAGGGEGKRSSGHRLCGRRWCGVCCRTIIRR